MYKRTIFNPNNCMIYSLIICCSQTKFIIRLPIIYLLNRVMYPDVGDKKQNDKIFKQMYKSSIKASYFNHMAENKYTQKSKLQIEQINEEDEEVDQNTFRVMTGFVKPDDSFIVYHKTGKVYLQEEGFFSCIVSRKRYDIQIKNSKLIVSRSESEVTQFFNFDTEEIEVVSKGSYFILKVSHCEQKFYFQPVQKSKENIVDDWVNLINKIIGVTLGKQKHYVYLPIKDKKFYQQQHISHQQFEKSCNSLDIILFKSQHSAARIQRVFTDSEYDHVGVVLRNRKNEIFIYESTSGEGVGLTPWKHMIKFEWYNSTDKIAWRRLNIKLTSQDIATIEAFVAKTLGKEFELTLQKMFVFSSALKRSNEEQQKKTYFCSELVARLYKELLLLDSERSSTRYYPVDFSQKTKLAFKREGTYLEPERVLAFNR